MDHGIPQVTYSPDIGDLFRNFYVDWHTLSPATSLVYGVLLAFFILGIVKKRLGDD